MKNLNTIFTVVLGIAVVVLFGLFFNLNSKSKAVSEAASASDSTMVLPVAYVNVDSLLTQYQYSRDLNEQILRKTESAQATINQQGRALEAEIAEFQRKVQNNAFFDRERYEKEQQRIMKKQEEFQKLNQRLALELQQKQDEINQILRDTIMSQLKNYNAVAKYQIIYSNTMSDNILLADKVYDITEDFVKYLNKNYTPAPTTQE